MSDWTISWVGDSAIVSELEPRIDPALNARIIRVAEAVRRAEPGGVRDVVESYHAVTVHFDPLRTDVGAVVAILERELAASAEAAHAPDPGDETEPVIIPVCYGGGLGPDLPAVAEHAGLSISDVIEIHARESYRVYMLGFLPGFAYMGSVPETIAMPRRPSPRVRVPAGSVGIAGRQTGVYPLIAPGGWQLIGATPLLPFRVDQPMPFMFRPGQSVRFEPIDAATYDTLRGTARV